MIRRSIEEHSEHSEIEYLTGKTLGELQVAVNEFFDHQSYLNFTDNKDEKILLCRHWNLVGSVKYLNGEYVQTVEHGYYKYKKPPRRRNPATKKTARAVKKVGEENDG